MEKWIVADLQFYLFGNDDKIVIYAYTIFIIYLPSGKLT